MQPVYSFCGYDRSLITRLFFVTLPPVAVGHTTSIRRYLITLSSPTQGSDPGRYISVLFPIPLPTP